MQRNGMMRQPQNLDISNMDTKVIKIILAVLLFGCILSMPYGYFQLVRFLTAIGLIYLAIKESNRGNLNIIYVILALLFQPLFKISLGRELWNIVDVILGLWLIIDALNYKNQQK